ncbi:MAG: phenylacetate--CoA ligase family protein [Candidatus Lokiarchaeia archaeon]
MWRPSIETIPRNEINKIQEERLKRQLRYVYEFSAFHKKKFDESGVKPGDIKALSDLKKLPLIGREDMEKEVSFEDIFGGRCCVPEEKVIIVSNPPEPQVKEPLIMTAITDNDRERMVEQMTRTLRMLGLKRGYTVEVQASQWELISRFIEAHFMFRRGVQSLVPFISIPIEITLFLIDIPRALTLTRFFKPQIIITTMDNAQLMEGELEKEGGTPKSEFSPEVVIHRIRPGAPILTEENRKEFEAKWGGNHVKMLDLQDNHFYATECLECKGMHVWEDEFIIETVDPNNGEPTTPGEKGNLTITNLWEEATPLIRYATDQVATISTEKCTCGRTHARIIM